LELCQKIYYVTKAIGDSITRDARGYIIDQM